MSTAGPYLRAPYSNSGARYHLHARRHTLIAYTRTYRPCGDLVAVEKVLVVVTVHARKAKIGNLEHATGADEQIGRLEVLGGV